jgi:uncharacterized protein involved in outer membrane biogenesis
MDPKPQPKTRSRRARIAAFTVVGLAAAYGLIVGLIVPHFARGLIAEKVGEKLGRAVALDDLSINPYTLYITAKGFRILEADRKTVFASFDQLDVNGSIESLYRFAPVADEVTLSGLKVSLVRDGETHYNVTDILGRLAAQQPAKDAKSDPARFSISNIRLVNARVDFDDRPKATKHQVTDIDVAIPFISNLPTHLKEYVQPRFFARVNGTPMHLTGETQPFENSLRTHVALDLDALELPRYIAYAPSGLPVRLDHGMLDARISVRFTQAAGKNPSVDIAGKLALRELALSSPDPGPLAGAGRIDAEIASFDPLGGTLAVKSVKVADVAALKDEVRIPLIEAGDIRVDIVKKTVRVESLATSDGVVSLKRRRDGTLELPLRGTQAQAEPSSSPAEPAPNPAQPSSNPWAAALGKLALANYRITVADASVKPATTHRVTVTQLEAADLSTEKGSKATMNARLALDKGGVEVASTIGMDPLSLNAKVEARRIDLVPLRPYVDQFATIGVKSANVSAKGNVTVSGEGKAMRVAYNGSAELANVATIDTVDREDLLNWDSVRAGGVAFKWSRDDPLDVAVAEIAVRKIYARVVVTPEGKINLQQLKSATPGNPQPAAQPEEASKPRNVRIDRITFEASRLNFTDHFIKPNYTADVGELNGSVTNLSSDPAVRGVVDLKGSYDKTSPVTIAGTVNPLSGNLFLDIAAKGKDIELPRLSAYSARYAGYGIKEGKLTLDVKYHLEDGKLQGRNNIFIDQLTFGDKVEGPEATKLPVLFAVNLLKDSKGAINLELPISGSLSDPQFEVGALISQVVVNLLKKAVTSPFSLLSAALGGAGGGAGADGKGAANGGSADDLAFVDFAPGRADIGPAGEKKLDSLSRALLDRPAISLEMAAGVDAKKDLAAMKRAALDAQVKAAKGGDVAEAEYPRYLKAVYEAQKLPKPPPKDGKAQELSVAEMESALLDRIQIGDAELNALAARRSEQVKTYLVGKGQLPAQRVVIAAASATPATKEQLARVDFTLR